ncbi:MAG: anti-sigma factor [Microbacteriaceae bacterium]
MTERTPNTDAELAQLSGAYALNALSADEAQEFERYLEHNSELRWEVTELADTAVELGLATAPVEPPASLKASILDQIARTPQLPLASTSTYVAAEQIANETAASLRIDERSAPERSAAERSAAERSAAERSAAERSAAEHSADPFAAPLGSATRKAQSRWYQGPLTALVAVAAVAGLVVGGGILSNVVSSSREQSVQADRLAAINAADDMQQAVSDVTGGGTATLVWSNELLASAVIVDGLAPLPESKVYELWYIGESGPRAAGTFTVDESGTSWRVLDGDMKAGDTVGVTVEPRGGSGAPTTDPIVAIVSA